MRWQDVLGFAGLGLVVLGTLFMFPSSSHGIRWAYLLYGSFIWVVGFTMVTGWLAWRWSIGQRAEKERPASPPTERRHSDRRSQRTLAA